MNEEKTRLRTKKEFAEIIRATTRHVDNLVARREIAVTRTGRLVRFTPEAIEAYLAASTTPTVGK